MRVSSLSITNFSSIVLNHNSFLELISHGSYRMTLTSRHIVFQNVHLFRSPFLERDERERKGGTKFAVFFAGHLRFGPSLIVIATLQGYQNLFEILSPVKCRGFRIDYTLYTCRRFTPGKQ